MSNKTQKITLNFLVKQWYDKLDEDKKTEYIKNFGLFGYFGDMVFWKLLFIYETQDSEDFPFDRTLYFLFRESSEYIKPKIKTKDSIILELLYNESNSIGLINKSPNKINKFNIRLNLLIDLIEFR